MNESTDPLISIVILNYNAEEFLHECIRSIYKTEKVSFEVIVEVIVPHHFCAERCPKRGGIDSEFCVGLHKNAFFSSFCNFFIDKK